jgi:hypothetical protein
MRSALAALAALGVLALAIAIAVTQYQERGDTQTELERTRQELAELREQLRATAPRPQEPRPQEQQPEGGGGPGNLLEELGGCPAAVGEQDGGGLEGLLEGLTEDAPDSQEELTDIVAQRVEELRELDFDEPVDPEFLDDRELRERVRELLEEDYSREEADRDGRALKALGAIPPDADLYALADELLAGQVAGLYEPSSETLLVESGDDPGALEELTLAHELEHALADQTLELPVPDEPDPARADGDLAGLALIEGDAMLLTQVYGARHIGRSMRCPRWAIWARWSTPSASSPHCRPTCATSCCSPTPPARSSFAASTRRVAGTPLTRPTSARPPPPPSTSSPRATARRSPSTRRAPATWAVPGEASCAPPWAPPSSCGSSRPREATPSAPWRTRWRPSPPGPAAS